MLLWLYDTLILGKLGEVHMKTLSLFLQLLLSKTVLKLKYIYIYLGTWREKKNLSSLQHISLSTYLHLNQ